MALVIKKRVAFDFLGDGYEEAYLDFKSIPVLELGELQEKLPKDDQMDGKSLKVILDILKKYFLGGRFPDEKGELSDVTTDDLDALDAEALLKSFQKLTDVDANLEPPLTTTSGQ